MRGASDAAIWAHDREPANHDWFDYDAIQHLWITIGGYGNMDDNDLRKPEVRRCAL
jgi:hypothetical protein